MYMYMYMFSHVSNGTKKYTALHYHRPTHTAGAVPRGLPASGWMRRKPPRTVPAEVVMHAQWPVFYKNFKIGRVNVA